MESEQDTGAGDVVSARDRFAEALRDARELHVPRQLSQTDLARIARTSRSTISRLENSKGPIPQELPATLDRVFGTDGVFRHLSEEAASQAFPELYRRRMTLEREAVAIWEWSPSIVPGLLQSHGYAREILRAGDPRAGKDELTASVRTRLARQDLFRAATPPDFRVVLCESVVRRRIGSPDVMREQLMTLLSHGQRPTTRIQILPLDAEAHLLVNTPITFLTAPTHMTLLYVESYHTAGIVEDLERIREAKRAFDDLMGEALSARDSADFIRARMEEW
ncbi:helix-turn-helix domain-containing protein [Streptomyces katsurahamanus]|uniref:Helix-turn-helix transcriptional regulator n=1 Tax=Streptomyces katsurahamanus TaxID=2577098 RepID=A0ABW9P1E1_9ACTN|nr:helix-turn-helix transcriptional regulator [Streptomyces katsurahamanus]MQS39411.1 helix-turn-helix transcriptional regulator [Streptomyces katsurahamanus]